ncbi:hypothetical protein [Bdellovibrio sp. HCB337]|uniref:hypothetical protein n=1 Tax=Bdellovibrio sp. HCB337 TaxID=3394358 RepID=UPI0039A5E7B0
MKFLGVLVLILSLSAFAKDKNAGFKEVHSSDESSTETSSDSEAASTKEEEPKVVLKENEEILSGTVRIIRKIDETEVFFKDIKDSYFIPSSPSHNAIFKALSESQKKGTSVSFKANTKTRRIVSMESGKTKTAPATTASDSGNNKPGSQ